MKTTSSFEYRGLYIIMIVVFCCCDFEYQYFVWIIFSYFEISSSLFQLFKCKLHKMVKHTQAIRLAWVCLTIFWGWHLKGYAQLSNIRHGLTPSWRRYLSYRNHSICGANQWSGFCMIRTYIMKESKLCNEKRTWCTC